MDETTAKFELLKLELQSIQAGIRGMDTIMFQIKGWCVTVAVATAGVALTSSHIELVAVGGAAVVGFWLVDAHYKSMQRIFIDRDDRIEEVLARQEPLAALAAGQLHVPGLASSFRNPASLRSLRTCRTSSDYSGVKRRFLSRLGCTCSSLFCWEPWL